MALRTPLSVTPHLYMGDSTGRPLDMGTVYFGEQDKDPEFYPINLFSDDALTLPLAQPVHTKGGYLYDKGDMVEPHAKELIYSVKVLDSYGRKVFYKGAMMRNSWNDDVIEQINTAIIGSADVARQVAADITNDAINNTAVEGGVLADTFVTVTANGVGAVARTQRDVNADTLHINTFNPPISTTIDAGASLRAATAAAKLENKTLLLDADQELYINSAVHFDCSISGGIFRLGPNADFRLRINETDSLRKIDAQIINDSGVDTVQALICESIDKETRRGYVHLNLKLHGFINGVVGKYLKLMYLDPSFYAYSRNTVAGKYAEAHCGCVMTDMYIPQGMSDGGVLGFSSGAGVLREIYRVSTINSYDHGVYSSSPTGKILTFFDNCKVMDSGGSGLKCFSNGDLHIDNAVVKNAAKVGIIPVANRAYINGGSLDEIKGAAVHHIGKDVGAGVNTFDSLIINGLTVRNAENDGVRIYGLESINKIEIINSNIECAMRPFVNLDFQGYTNSVKRLDVYNSSLITTSTNSAVIYSVGLIDDINISNSSIIANTSISNLIDVSAKRLNLVRPTFIFESIPRLVRNRYATGVITETGTVSRGSITTSPAIRQDGGVVDSSTSYFDDVGNYVRVSHGNTPPTTGSWSRGDITYNRAAETGGFVGWVCTISGTPGSWRPFGAIQSGNIFTSSNATVKRVLNAETATTKDVADVLATLISELQRVKIIS